MSTAIKESGINWKEIHKKNEALQNALNEYLESATPEGQPAALSAETTLLGQELRADWNYGAEDRNKPLRLLSLGKFCFPLRVLKLDADGWGTDGGGVRGISSLHVLKAIMKQVAGDPNAKPCDYFDMMCGTSTGGYVAGFGPIETLLTSRG